MKKYCLFVFISVLFLKCDAFTSTLTITNNCTENISVHISYSATNVNGETNSFSDSLELDPGETDSVEINSSGDTYITVWAFNSETSAMFSYYGTDNEIIVTDADFGN